MRSLSPALLCLLFACSFDKTSDVPIPPPRIGGDRPVDVHTPTAYDPAQALPLVVVLHGYMASGEIMEAYLDLQAAADKFNFIYITPNGNEDTVGNLYWNATDACCDIFEFEIDDSKYLRNVIESITAQYAIDLERIYVFGHSNGGFMAHRMGCDHADLLAGIVSVAGSTYSDPMKCQPSQPINMLQIHGDHDGVILYNGGTTFGGRKYPGAQTTTARWAGHNGCEMDGLSAGADLDLESTAHGSETVVTQYGPGCKAATQLWTMRHTGHVPQITSNFVPTIANFMLDHPKP